MMKQYGILSDWKVSRDGASRIVSYGGLHKIKLSVVNANDFSEFLRWHDANGALQAIELMTDADKVLAERDHFAKELRLVAEDRDQTKMQLNMARKELSDLRSDNAKLMEDRKKHVARIKALEQYTWVDVQGARSGRVEGDLERERGRRVYDRLVEIMSWGDSKLVDFEINTQNYSALVAYLPWFVGTIPCNGRLWNVKKLWHAGGNTIWVIGADGYTYGVPINKEN